MLDINELKNTIAVIGGLSSLLAGRNSHPTAENHRSIAE